MEGDGILASRSNCMCESVCACTGTLREQNITVNFAPIRSAIEMRCCGRDGGVL